MNAFYPEVSNREDWTIQFYAEDEDTGEAIDFSTATEITFTLRDKSWCQRISATMSGGEVTTPTTGLVEIAIPQSDMQNLCAGDYPIGCTYELNSVTAQLFVGSAQIYDGIVP